MPVSTGVGSGVVGRVTSTALAAPTPLTTASADHGAARKQLAGVVAGSSHTTVRRRGRPETTT
jgi:hypothetical protein